MMTERDEETRRGSIKILAPNASEDQIEKMLALSQELSGMTWPPSSEDERKLAELGRIALESMWNNAAMHMGYMVREATLHD